MSETTTAVVTGAARGIGFEVARQLSERGHRVLLTDLDEVAVKGAAERIGNGAWGMTQDVAGQASHRAVAEEASRHGALKVWVNNAGILFAGDAWTAVAG